MKDLTNTQKKIIERIESGESILYSGYTTPHFYSIDNSDKVDGRSITGLLQEKILEKVPFNSVAWKIQIKPSKNEE